MRTPGTIVIATDHNVHYGADLGRRAFVRGDDGETSQLADLMTGEEFSSLRKLWTPATAEVIRVGHGQVRHFLADPELLRLPCGRRVQANRITLREDAHTIRVAEPARARRDGEILVCGRCEFALGVWRQQVNYATPITSEVVDSFSKTVADRLRPGPDFDQALRDILQHAIHWATLAEQPADADTLGQAEPDAAAALGQAIVHATDRHGAVSRAGWKNYINAAHAWVIQHDIHPAWDAMRPREQREHLIGLHHFGILPDDPIDTEAAGEDHAADHKGPAAPPHAHHTRIGRPYQPRPQER